MRPNLVGDGIMKHFQSLRLILCNIVGLGQGIVVDRERFNAEHFAATRNGSWTNVNLLVWILRIASTSRWLSPSDTLQCRIPRCHRNGLVVGAHTQCLDAMVPIVAANINGRKGGICPIQIIPCVIIPDPCGSWTKGRIAYRTFLFPRLSPAILIGGQLRLDGLKLFGCARLRNNAIGTIICWNKHLFFGFLHNVLRFLSNVR
mmetsp:Transcript_12938/g.18551  ORF Transcript_12938/g.18551 Transcript_12938/m.18551 type:complete len:203 (-) Transcript_12938:531-1139(-)